MSYVFMVTQEPQQLKLFLPHLDHTAERSKLHYPQLEGRPWFPYTEAHVMLELKLTPCANLLYHWVLTKTPAGTSIEVDLRDFRALTAEHRRGRAYSMKQIRRAVSELEELQLVEITSERVRMKPKHPGPVANRKPKDKTSIPQSGHQCQTRDINVPAKTLMSKSKAETSTTRSSELSSDLYRSNRSTTTEPVAVASEILLEDPWNEQLPSGVSEVISVEQAKQTQSTAASPSKKVEQDNESESKPTVEGQYSAVQLEAIKKLGIILSYQLKALLATLEPPQIDEAIACFKEDLAGWSGEMKNPAGCFSKVLKQVQQGRRPVQHPQLQLQDPIEAALEMWRERWQKCLVISRAAMVKDIAVQFPGGEIIIRDFDEGPILGK